MNSKKIYEMVSDIIIEQLEGGTVPWRRPWVNGMNTPVNWVTQKAYRGINIILLPPGEYATFKQIKDSGGKVKKGQKGSPVVFWKWLEREDEETGETNKFPFLRYYTVFEINTQVEGLTSKRKLVEPFEHSPIEEAENIINGFDNKPSLNWGSGLGAWYRPSDDYLNIPPMSEFEKVEEYYSTFFHELVHSTGHTSRLNREGVRGVSRFGSEDYSKEELVAEIGASMLTGMAGFQEVTFENSTAYIQSWLRQLKDDKTLIVSAAAQSQKAVDHILGVTFKD